MNRPEWMPEEQVILMIQDGEYIDGEIDDAFRKTGLRAQIAVLEECVEELNGFSWAQLKIAALRKELEG